jgi:AmmeMemoRadiSam system protein B
MTIRPAAVAGSWYPGTSGALTREVDNYLDGADDGPDGDVMAVIAPHAGIMFSGPVAAFAYKAAARHRYDSVVLVGPSHFVAFDGVALYPRGAFETPLGLALVNEDLAAAVAHSGIVRELRAPHFREHSLEMQLPFLKRLMPEATVVPLLMGIQTAETITELAIALGDALRGARTLLVASTDLSHYFDAETAEALDSRVRDAVDGFDTAALMRLIEGCPEGERGRYVGCGAGPMIAVMLAAKILGATDARVLRYANSGEVSGDYSAVVGYMAAAIGRFAAPN